MSRLSLSRGDCSGRRQKRSGSTSPSDDRRHVPVFESDVELSPLNIALLLALGAAIACCALVLASPARAIYGPAAGGLGADIVSVDNASDEQANGASSDAAISANGRYVVFQTKATNFFENDGVPGGDPEPPGACREGGIFRYDRDTGELALVADGTEVALNAKGECDPSQVIFRGAENPSVSAEGRYVAFSTAQQLVPHVDEHNENVEVYERDMNVPLSTDRMNSGAYTLVSAQNGSEEAPVYEDSKINPPLAGGDPGAELWPNSAISANGRYVLFRTETVPSSLPDRLTPTTPPDQLFVRDLLAKTTTLINRTSAGHVPKECGEGGTSAGDEPACGADGPATLSADGSTVAWVGSHAESQTVFLPGEDPDESTPYYLWQRWREPDAPTRRVTGIADPEDPECKSGEGIEPSPTATGPCYGPLTFPESHAGISSQAPALSADGYTVAFLTGSGLRPDFQFKPESLDAFLTSMAPGVTRKAGTRELTLAVNGAQGDGNASITSLAMSSDGSRVAFVSQRNAFVLGEPAATGSFSVAGEQSELFVIDLTTNTLERAVVGLEGAEPNGSTANNPTLSENGSTLAFVSQASNLIFGDANGFSDAFTATLQTPGGTAAPPGGVNAGSGGFSLTALSYPELGVSLRRAKDGGVTLLVETPGPGKLTAKALGSIPKATSAKTAKKARAGSTLARVSRTGKTTKKKPAKKKAPPAVLLASTSASARSEGTTTLTLHISSKYVKDLQHAGKLKANIIVGFAPTNPSESVLTDEVSATFVTASPAKKSSATGKGKAKKGNRD
jgi:Tol biopolymer transport system component